MSFDAGDFMVHRFAVGDLVERGRWPGAVFRVVGITRDYDAWPLVLIKFAGPRRWIPPTTRGRLPKRFRIVTLTVEDQQLIPANPMLALAAFAGG